MGFLCLIQIWMAFWWNSKLFTCPCLFPLKRIWFWLRFWLTNLRSPLYLPLFFFLSSSFLYTSHSDLFVLPLTTGPKEGIGCSAILQRHIFLSVAGYTLPDFCKCAGGLLTPFASIPKLNRGAITVLLPIPLTLRLNTKHENWPTYQLSGFYSYFLLWDGLPNCFLIHTCISIFLVWVSKWDFNNLMLWFLTYAVTSSLPHCSLVHLADFIERRDLRILIKRLVWGCIGSTIHNCEVFSLFL